MQLALSVSELAKKRRRNAMNASVNQVEVSVEREKQDFGVLGERAQIRQQLLPCVSPGTADQYSENRTAGC